MASRSNVNTVLVASILVTASAAIFYIDLPARASAFSGRNLSSVDANDHSSDYDPLLPLQTSDIFGFAFATAGLMIAAGGGIGGGGMLVPIYILVSGFVPKHAIPLSNVTVFGGAIANNMLNWRKRHPDADRPLIDWDIICVMEPATLAGTLLGANLNKILPEAVIGVMLVLLLLFTAHTTLKKARKRYQKETEEIKRQSIEAKPDHDGADESTHLLSNQSLSDGENGYGEEKKDDDDQDLPEDNNEDLPKLGNPVLLQEILEEEKHPSQRNISLIVIMFVVVLLVNALKGGGGFKSPIGIECGSAAFWTAQTLLLVWIISISRIGRNFLLKDSAKKAEAGYTYLDEDILWDTRTTIIYPLISTLAGVFAGMFGIGGGIVKGPLMLAMGIHPAVASATSACMILFTSLTATTTFCVYGLMIPDYAVACGLLGFFATLLGQTLMTRLMAKSNRNSYISFAIGFVVLLSALLMTLESVLDWVKKGNGHEVGGLETDEDFSDLITGEENETFNGFCDSVE